MGRREQQIAEHRQLLQDNRDLLKNPPPRVGRRGAESGAKGTVRNNILVGNEIGFSCHDCDLDAGYDLVWGNEVDYAGEASPAPSDLGLDPRFRSPGERDWRLLPDSPAIDAADLRYSVDHDRDGESRLLGAGSDLGMDEFRSSSVSIAITEVMAQPLVESTGEFIELLNLGTTGVELSGLLVSDGDETEALLAWNGSPTLVGPGAFALIVDAQFAGQYEIPVWVPVLTTLDLDLGDGLSRADPVRIFEPDGGTLVSTFSTAIRLPHSLWCSPATSSRAISCRSTDAAPVSTASSASSSWDFSARVMPGPPAGSPETTSGLATTTQ